MSAPDNAIPLPSLFGPISIGPLSLIVDGIAT